MTAHPVEESEAVGEYLRAATLEVICNELLRRAKLCNDMASDCLRFAAHESDFWRKRNFQEQSKAFVAKGRIYADMVEKAVGR
jgi:hypothetical protein